MDKGDVLGRLHEEDIVRIAWALKVTTPNKNGFGRQSDKAQYVEIYNRLIKGNRYKVVSLDGNDVVGKSDKYNKYIKYLDTETVVEVEEECKNGLGGTVEIELYFKDDVFEDYTISYAIGYSRY